MSEEINFGDHVKIEQKRHGAPNEFYFYKVIGTFRSNSYVEVPVQSTEKETIVNHKVVQVVACICCGVSEVDVRNFRLEDVKLVDLPKATETTEILNEVKADKGILTEEELKELEDKFSFSSGYGKAHYPMVEKMVISHRELLRANAELSFKNNEFKKRIQRILDYNQPVGYEDYEIWTSILRSLLTKTLEELK